MFLLYSYSYSYKIVHLSVRDKNLTHVCIVHCKTTKVESWLDKEG